MSQLQLKDAETDQPVDWQNAQVYQNGFPSHLQQEFEIEDLKLSQTLFYISPHSAIITSRITNTSSEKTELHPHWKGKLFPIGARIESGDKGIGITFSKSPSRGVVQALGSEILNTSTTDSTYDLRLEIIELAPGESRELILAHGFYFPPTNWAEEQSRIGRAADDPTRFLEDRINEKKAQLTGLCDRLDSSRMDTAYRDLLVKTVLTLQNNWRSPAGELTHSGLFPSYHQKWFHGYWAWDSWKHAVALGHCDPVLAREQIRAMYAFQKEDGFIPDCVFRDTTIENHNLRNTKPPLSAWAAWEVHRQSPDRDFLQELYPKIKKQHQWWYENRDHDGDRVCEYGSTDGSLVAAKWESGMDNAVRFDQSQLLENTANAFSLDQESVDLNAYLYAEKKYLALMAGELGKKEEQDAFAAEAEVLKGKIQEQFFDPVSGWFYDTNLEGGTFVEAMGCEGWIPLWAEAASPEQAEAVKNNMVNPSTFNTKVPFQTLSADHPKFKPDRGYWRGPNWLDQSYFGVRGLRNYGFVAEANEATYKLIHNAEGVLGKGRSIRENYHPITGEGMEAENFSWSAAHYLLLLINE